MVAFLVIGVVVLGCVGIRFVLLVGRGCNGFEEGVQSPFCHCSLGVSLFEVEGEADMVRVTSIGELLMSCRVLGIRNNGVDFGDILHIWDFY